MKSNIKKLIAAVVVLALIIGLYFVVPLILPENKPEENIDANTAEEIISEDEYVVYEKTENVDQVTFNTGEITYTIINDETPEIVGYSSNVIDTGSLFMALFKSTIIGYSKKIGSVENPADYGLDKEDKYVSIKLVDGKERKVIIGNPTNIGGEYYAKNSESDVVYVINESTAQTLLKHPKEYRNLDVVQISPETITAVAVDKKGEKTLEFKYESTKEESGQAIHTYKMEFPYKGVKANYDSINMFCQNLGTVTAVDIVEENPVALSRYGLDKPYVLKVTDDNGTSIVKMGNYTDDGYVYVMKADIPVVYKAECKFYEAVKNLKADEFVERFIHLFNIDTVSKITVKNSEKTHKLTVTEKSKDSYEYKINGKIKVKENFTPIFTSIIGVTASSYLPGILPTGEEVCVIDFVFNDNTKKTFTYFRYDDRYCIVKADNGLSCLVTTKSVEDIFKAFEK